MLFPQFPGIIKPMFNIFLGDTVSYRTPYDYSTFIGEKFGKWRVESFVYLKKRFHFFCICSCGEASIIQSSSLINGNSKSCVVCAPKKHGYYASPTNRSWSGARNRCYNPKNKDYKDYGGRGIKMCDRWNKFELFLEDMGERPKGLTLDRIDNNGNYEASNCRWATYSQQNSNQRKRAVVKKVITEGK